MPAECTRVMVMVDRPTYLYKNVMQETWLCDLHFPIGLLKCRENRQQLEK